MVDVLSAVLVLIMGAVLSFLCFYAAYLLEKAQERKAARKQLMASAVETYISMRDRKHRTMREMRRVAREYNDPESRG